MRIKTIQDIQTLPVAEESFSTEKRKQVGLLGGNFNPIHVTHLIVADQVGRSLGLDRVDLMPSFTPPHVDRKETIDANHRLAMIELAIEGNSMLGIETIELTRGGTSYTYETMLALKEKNPDTDYFFIIGGDMVEYLPKWHRIDELMTLVQFVGVQRPNYPRETSYPVIWVDVPLMEISSTIVRTKIAQGCSIRYFVPDSVQAYIEEKGLYQDDNQFSKA